MPEEVIVTIPLLILISLSAEIPLPPTPLVIIVIFAPLAFTFASDLIPVEYEGLNPEPSASNTAAPVVVIFIMPDDRLIS